MSDSDVSSSEMSDDALHKLVSRLVEVGEEEGRRQSPGRVAGASVSVESSGDDRLLAAATGQPIWPSSTPDQPSPIQPRRSPRPDGLHREAEVLANANDSDCSTEEERAGAALAMATIGAEEPEAEAEADSCGYEGDVGEGNKKLAASSRRGSVISHPHPGFSINRDGAEEADDEGSGKEATKCHAHAHLKPFGTMAQMNKESPWPWEALNSSLREHGFREVSLKRTADATSPAVPDPASVANTLRDVMFKHGERGKVIQEMSLELQRLKNVSGHRDSVLNDSFRRETSNLSRRSAGAEARVAALEEEKERLQDQLANQIRRSKTENASLSSQLKQSEHRVKAKEAAAQKLMDKLQQEAEKERLSQQRDRALLMKFQQNETFRGCSVSDTRVTESLVAHSKAQQRSEAEMDELRAEVSRLGDDLREKENTILKYRLGPDWSPDLDPSVKDTPASEEIRDLRARLAESDRGVVIMTQRERRAVERCANMEHQCAEIQTKADETQEALVNAQLELTSRPSVRSWRVSQRRLKDLEAKLGQATNEAKEALGIAELRRWVDTAELIRRDRENHRLKLDRLEELPTTVLAQVVQDSCRLLALQDVSLLSSSVSKLVKAVQMLPRLERFVNSVCSFVFAHSPNVASAPSGGNARTMEGVLPLLKLWLARAQAPVKLKDFQQELTRVLETRAGKSQDGSSSQLFKSDRAMLSAVEHLVEFERRSLREVHQNEEADRSVNDDPSPVNRVVRHFQLLFGVTTIGGCLPKLNEVYRFSSEAKTFLRNCGDLLDMSSHSDTAIMRRLETLLEGRIDVEPEVCLRVSHGAGSWKASR